MDIVPLQLKIKNFYYEIKKYNNCDNTTYIENGDERVFQKMKEIWNKIIKLIGKNNAPDFIKYNLDDEKYIMADVLENTNSLQSNCHKDEIIIVLHSFINNIIKSSLLEVTEYEYY